MSHDRQDFEQAWSRRPWIAEDESDKDRAWRWWKAALESRQCHVSSHQEQVEGILISAVPSLGTFGARELAQQLSEAIAADSRT